MPDAAARLDVGCMIRSREGAGSWNHVQVLDVYVFFDAPNPPR